MSSCASRVGFSKIPAYLDPLTNISVVTSMHLTELRPISVGMNMLLTDLRAEPCPNYVQGDVQTYVPIYVQNYVRIYVQVYVQVYVPNLRGGVNEQTTGWEQMSVGRKRVLGRYVAITI